MRGRKPWVRYTVYDNKTDLPIIVDGTAVECAGVLNRSEASFRTMVTRTEQGKTADGRLSKVPSMNWRNCFEKTTQCGGTSAPLLYQMPQHRCCGYISGRPPIPLQVYGMRSVF